MKLAMVFPGQGSQSVGMLAELAGRYPEVQATFLEASEALDYDLWNVCQEGPADTLNSTETTQPAMLTAGYAVWQVLQARGARHPDLMAGHSLGEYTALVCSKALSFRDAVQVVRDRGRFMQEAVPHGEGAVAAVLGLDDELVLAACEAAAEGEVVRAVNFNAPGQVVIAGHTGAVERSIEAAKTAGAKKAMKLPLSVPVHSPLMEPAAKRFAERLEQVRFEIPSVPVLSNVDLLPHRSVQGIRENLAKQLYQPVRWTQTVEIFVTQGVDRVIESGPGKVLAGLNRRIARSMGIHAAFDVASVDAALEAIAE